MEIIWNKDKNLQLRHERGVCFEEIAIMIQNNRIIDIIDHPNKKKYPLQKIYVIKFKNYIYYVPFIRNEKEIFLKTIFPSRKAFKKYAGGDHEKKT